MEQQNQQPIQEQRNLHSGKKFLDKHKLSLIAAIIVIVLTVGGILLLKTLQPAPSSTPIAQQTLPPTPSPQPQALDTSNWQTYRNDEFGFELKYPEDWRIVKYREGWWIEPGRLAVEISQAPYENIFLDNVPIKIGQDMLDVVIANTGIDCLGCHASRDKISTRNFGDNSFYYVFHSLFEGQYGVVYYLQDPDDNSAIRFWLNGFTKSEKNWTDPDYNVDNEPNHSVLKQILSTFRFVEK